MKVRAIWEFEADVSDLDPKYVNIPGLAKELTQRELDDLISKSGIAAVDFEYEVVSEPLILEEEDYPGEQFELLRKVFGVPVGTTMIRIDNYDISTFVPSTTEKKPETCRERLKREHPEFVSDNACFGCPTMYGYLPNGTLCVKTQNAYPDCRACWDRPVEEVKNR